MFFQYHNHHMHNNNPVGYRRRHRTNFKQLSKLQGIFLLLSFIVIGQISYNNIEFAVASSSSSSYPSSQQNPLYVNRENVIRQQQQQQQQTAPVLSQQQRQLQESQQQQYQQQQQSQQEVQQQYQEQVRRIVVVGSLNVDTFLPVDRLPVEGENIGLRHNSEPIFDVPGGKGCTQAIAAAKLLKSNGAVGTVEFVGQLGNDNAGGILYHVLSSNSIPLLGYGTLSQVHQSISSGRGYVFLTTNGQVSAVVVGGTNMDGWDLTNVWEPALETYLRTGKWTNEIHKLLEPIFSSNQVDAILFQCEIPDVVNTVIAMYSERYSPSTLLILDVGGEDRMINPELLKVCQYVIPNETELHRLYKHCDKNSNDNGDSSGDKLSVIEMARYLQEHYNVQNIIVTQGRDGSTYVSADGTTVHHQPASCVVGNKVVDETGAGDCYRAAFVTQLLQSSNNDNNQLTQPSLSQIQWCMEYASAAGACAVEVNGAIPSTPTSNQIYHRIQYNRYEAPRRKQQQQEQGSEVSDEQQQQLTDQEQQNTATIKELPTNIPSGGNDDDANNDFPFLIGSRLNSMKDRPELWDGSALDHPYEYVKRQATVQGLTCVDFNYPQHFPEDKFTVQQAKAALDEYNLKAGAVCLRYPAPKYTRGAMNHPNPQTRRDAIQLTKDAAQTALDLGCNEVVVWSAFDGYDYPFQVNYDDHWQQLVLAFQECCDAYPTIKFSVEYKPTDENTRFFTVPSTGAACVLVLDVNRTNFGLTLDVGHMLMSGENPGQSIAMAARLTGNKVFGIQLNDGYTRLAAEDGLMFGSIHPSMALEIMYQLRRINFVGHFYFDTFPQRTDPIAEAEYNIRRLKSFWKAAGYIDPSRLHAITKEHDAIGALEIVNDALRQT